MRSVKLRHYPYSSRAEPRLRAVSTPTGSRPRWGTRGPFPGLTLGVAALTASGTPGPPDAPDGQSWAVKASNLGPMDEESCTFLEGRGLGILGPLASAEDQNSCAPPAGRHLVGPAIGRPGAGTTRKIFDLPSELPMLE